MVSNPFSRHPANTFHNVILFCLFLIASIMIVYGGVRNYGYINLDDDQYVTENLHIQKGVTFQNIKWAFKTFHAGNWHPVTWISHMIDCQLFGMDLGWHHLTNVLLHILNTLILLALFQEMTGEFRKSAFVAALFALHPLHVESVAWISERKDVLCAFWGFLTLWAYIRYIKSPNILKYFVSLFFFLLGLLSKPMLVTFPFVLILLDYWPLGRTRFYLSGNIPSGSEQPLLKLIVEKIPFFILVLISSAATFIAQHKGGAVGTFEAYPLSARIFNACISYIHYIMKMIFPVNLGVLYPFPSGIPVWQIGGALFLIVLITIIAIKTLKTYPYIAFGWFFYLGTLVPVIGIVQVGMQKMADRYTYIPLVGIFVIIAWGVPQLLSRWKLKNIFLIIISVSVLSFLTFTAKIQVGYWSDSISLFTHTLSVTKKNVLILNNLGIAYAEKGAIETSIKYFKKAEKIKPEDIDVLINLGIGLSMLNKNEEALAYFAKTTTLDPGNITAHNYLGTIYLKTGLINRAVFHFKEVLKINPQNTQAKKNMDRIMIQLNEKN